MEVIATNEKGEEIYNGIVKTKNGTVKIPEFRQTGKVNFKIKEVSVPNKHGDGFRNFYELTEKHGKNFARSECEGIATSGRKYA